MAASALWGCAVAALHGAHWRDTLGNSTGVLHAARTAASPSPSGSGFPSLELSKVKQSCCFTFFPCMPVSPFKSNKQRRKIREQENKANCTNTQNSLSSSNNLLLALVSSMLPNWKKARSYSTLTSNSHSSYPTPFQGFTKGRGCAFCVGCTLRQLQVNG